MTWDYKETSGKDILGGEIDPRPTERIYGFLPSSIWNIGTKKGTLRLFMKDEIAMGSYSDETKRKTSLSEMHPEVIERCVKFWSLKGDTIFDPFAGRGTRAIVTKSLGRNYIGQDLSREFYEHIINRFKSQTTLNNPIITNENDVFKIKEKGIKIEIRWGDSRKIDLERESIDMILTSPPYWNIEYYGPEEGQLYRCKTYSNFLSEMYVIIKNCYKILRKGRFVCWIVNDIRREGEMLNYHGDTINLFKKAGFTQHDIVIYNLNTPAITGLTRCDRYRYTIKSHEYILVFRK